MVVVDLVQLYLNSVLFPIYELIVEVQHDEALSNVQRHENCRLDIGILSQNLPPMESTITKIKQEYDGTGEKSTNTVNCVS